MCKAKDHSVLALRNAHSKLALEPIINQLHRTPVPLDFHR